METPVPSSSSPIVIITGFAVALGLLEEPELSKSRYEIVNVMKTFRVYGCQDMLRYCSKDMC